MAASGDFHGHNDKGNAQVRTAPLFALEGVVHAPQLVLKVFALIGNVPVRSLQQQDCPALQGEVLRPHG